MTTKPPEQISDEDVSKRIREFLGEGMILDYAMVFIIASRLVKPIEKWDAFELGLIDEEGKGLRKPKTLKEKNAYTLLDKLILKLKHLIGHHKLRVLTAFLLLRETTDFTDSPLSDGELIDYYSKRAVVEKTFDELKERIHFQGLTMDDFWRYLMQQEISG